VSIINTHREVKNVPLGNATVNSAKRHLNVHSLRQSQLAPDKKGRNIQEARDEDDERRQEQGKFLFLNKSEEFKFWNAQKGHVANGLFGVS
jgi:hypothetical protein